MQLDIQYVEGVFGWHVRRSRGGGSRGGGGAPGLHAVGTRAASGDALEALHSHCDHTERLKGNVFYIGLFVIIKDLYVR